MVDLKCPFYPNFFLEVRVSRLLIDFFFHFRQRYGKAKYVLYILQHQSDCKVNKFTQRRDNIPPHHSCLQYSLSLGVLDTHVVPSVVKSAEIEGDREYCDQFFNLRATKPYFNVVAKKERFPYTWSS